VAANPVLATCEPDVECLLVRRSRRAHEHWLLGLDVAYALVAVIRRHWKGLGGGDTVRTEIDAFFDRLSRGLSPY
jgi:hypothetical protein